MQRYTSVDQAISAAPSAWIILHQGNQLNPYINYPFLTTGPLKKYIAEAHAKGAKVKLYYTVRVLISRPLLSPRCPPSSPPASPPSSPLDLPPRSPPSSPLDLPRCASSRPPRLSSGRSTRCGARL